MLKMCVHIHTHIYMYVMYMYMYKYIYAYVYIHTRSFWMVANAVKKVKQHDSQRVTRWGCLRRGVQEDFSEAAALEL